MLMKTTKYSTQINALDVDSPFQLTDIHYVNSIPGAGKTYAALAAAVQTLHNGDNADHVLVYAAPTHRLLDEFHAKLLESIHNNPRKVKRIKVINSKLKSGSVQQWFHGLLNGSTDHSRSVAKLPNGSVILVTHECLRLIPLNMSGKNRVSLIFDEARQCMKETMRMQMPPQVLNKIVRECVNIEEALQDTTVTRWSWRPEVKLDENMVRALWRKTHSRPAKLSIEKCMEFIGHLRNASQHIWVQINSDSEKVQDFQVNVTMSPSRMFGNYGKVLIMSAFFEHSQMYHMLKRQECDLTTSKGRKRASVMQADSIRLVDVTEQLIDHDRVDAIINKRMPAATMTYILEDESLGKYHLQRGIVIPRATPSELKLLSDQYLWLFAAEGHDKKKAPEFKSFWGNVLNTDDSVSIPTAAYERRGLILELKPSKYSVVQYMALQSLRLQKAWMNINHKKPQPLLLCVNAKESANEHSNLWDKEGLEELLNMDGNSVVEVPVVCQGLNEWDKYNTAAFMATTKMTPAQQTFLKALLPNYNPDLDRTVDQCIQFIFRSNLRKAESNRECFVIVSDKKLATQVNACLGGGMTIVEPQSLITKWHPKSIAVLKRTESPEVIRERNRRYQSTDAYRAKRKIYSSEYHRERVATDMGKEYRRLTSVIKRREDKLLREPKNAALIKEIAALREERSNLEK